MEHVIGDVWRIALPPRGAINAYLAGDVLIDAGYGPTAKRLVRELEGREVRVHALTHGHGDHAGGSRHVCEALGVPLWCPAGDVDAVVRGRPVIKPAPLGPLRRGLARVNGWAGTTPDRSLREGDEVGGFTVLETPGHSPGHVAYWRASDRLLIAGDVWFNLSLVTFKAGLRQPPWALTVDPGRNRRSMHRLADLEPDVVCFGHGPIVRDAAPKLRAFVDAL